MSERFERLKKGRVAELNVISKLIGSGLEVYTPEIDKGIDCIVRVEGTPSKYYDIQIKRSLRNVSVRGARKILEKVKAMAPQNYFLVIAIEKGEEEYDYIYLTGEEALNAEYHKEFPNTGEIDINIKAKEREELIKTHSLSRLISILKNETKA